MSDPEKPVGRPIEFTVQRCRRRRSIGIFVNQEAEVVLRVPQRLASREIERAVVEKRDWILDRQRHFKGLKEQFPKKRFTEGEIFSLLGNPLSFKKIHSEGRPNFSLERGSLVLKARASTVDSRVRTMLLSWYRGQALDVMQDRVPGYATQMRVVPGRIRIRDQKRRWGSCSSTGELFFNWRLVMMPLPIIDYVIVHELCHIRHPDHSPRFWKGVEGVLPDFRERRQWLRERTFEYTYPF